MREKKFLTASEAAEMLGVKLSSIYSMSHKRTIVVYKPGGKKLLFLRTDLEEYIDKGRIKSRSEIDSNYKKGLLENGEC